MRTRYAEFKFEYVCAASTSAVYYFAIIAWLFDHVFIGALLESHQGVTDIAYADTLAVLVAFVYYTYKFRTATSAVYCNVQMQSQIALRNYAIDVRPIKFTNISKS